MKLKTLAFATLICAPALFAFPHEGTKLAFAVAEGSTKQKTFTNTLEMSLDNMSMQINGQPSPAQPGIEMSINSKLKIEVTDDYVKMRPGGPATLKRTYDALEQTQSMSMEMEGMGTTGSQDSSTGAESELEGATVVFKWKEEPGEYVASFPEEGGDEKLLVDLTEDMDLRALLPESEVSEGDEWKVEPLALKAIFAPGGDLKLVPEESEGKDMFGGMGPDMGEQGAWFSEDLEGEVVATFKGVREADEGVRVGAIELRIKLSNAVDLTEKSREALEKQDLPPEVDDITVNSTDIEIDIEGEATLLWNLAEGCVYSFELSAQFSYLVDASMAVSAQGMKMEIENSMEFSGNMTTAVSIK